MLTSTDKDDLKDVLIELKCEIEGRGALFECTGFSSELIDDIVNRSQYLFTIQDLTRTSPIFSLRHAINVPFSSPEPTILLTCGRNRELWEQPF